MDENMFEWTNPIHWWHPQVCDHLPIIVDKFPHIFLVKHVPSGKLT